MTTSALEDRLEAIRKLTDQFRAERLVYLAVTTGAALLLLISAGVLILRSDASIPALTAIFGSSGLMTVTVARLLRMWERAVGFLEGHAPAGGSNG